MARFRLREPEARDLALRIAAACPNREASTTWIKDKITDYVALTPIDLQPSDTRNQEQKWQQIVGNVISHHASASSLFSKGLAIRTDDGLIVTDKGMAYLAKKGL